MEGTQDPEKLAQLAKGRLRQKRTELQEALAGYIREHHRFLIASHLTHLDFLEEQIALFDAQIMERITQGTQPQPTPLTPPPTSPGTPEPLSHLSAENPPVNWEKALSLLDTIPGVGRQTAQLLLAEIGSDMSRFKSEAHLALVGETLSR